MSNVHLDILHIFAIVINQKEVINLPSKGELKKIIEEKMSALCKELDRDALIYLFEHELKSLAKEMPLFAIIEWLEQFNKEKMPIAVGMVGVYKTELQDWDGAKRCFLETNRLLPNELWEGLIEFVLKNKIEPPSETDEGKCGNA